MNKNMKIIQLFIVTLAFCSQYISGSQNPNPYVNTLYPGQGGTPTYQPPIQTTWQSQQYYQQPSFGGTAYQPSAPSPSLATVGQPTLMKTTQPITAPTPTTTGDTSPIDSWVMQSMFQQIDNLWKLYSTAPRTNYQFNPQTWNNIKNYVAAIDNLSKQGTYKNNQLIQNCSNFINMFVTQNPALLITTSFVEQLNIILATLDNIIIANSNIYQPTNAPSVFGITPHNLLSPHGQIATGGKAAPALFKAQQALTGTAYEWGQYLASPVTGVLSTGWDWTKWAAGGVASGLGTAREYLFPSQEEVNKATRELPTINAEIEQFEALDKAQGLTAEQRATLEERKSTKYYYEGIIRGWKRFLALTATGALGAGYLYLKSK